MPHEPRRRSLIMAGGGVKVAFQAGVLQVWLDEAKVEFDHADGASGGVFNLAMWCQGMSGTKIADNWRTYRLSGPSIPTWARCCAFRSGSRCCAWGGTAGTCSPAGH